jgi:hypothetical protein
VTNAISLGVVKCVKGLMQFNKGSEAVMLGITDSVCPTTVF